MNINFKPHSRNDILYRVKWLNNKAANVFVIDDSKHVNTDEEQLRWFENYEVNENKTFFTILVDELPIGFMGLTRISDMEALVFIYIGEDDYRSKGIGKQSLEHLIFVAKNELDLRLLKSEVNKANQIAIKLNRSLGFKVVGENESEFLMSLNLGGG